MAAALRHVVSFIVLFALASCGDTPDSAPQRVAIGGSAQGPSAPIESPDVKGARWIAADADPDHLLYGKPGEPPLFSLACARATAGPVITYVRFAHADPGAQAMLALIGNRRVERLFVDAEKRGKGDRLWAGSIRADDPRLAVFEGTGPVEATVPGAGSLKLGGSPLPGALIVRCRTLAAPSPAPLPPAGPA